MVGQKKSAITQSYREKPKGDGTEFQYKNGVYHLLHITQNKLFYRWLFEHVTFSMPTCSTRSWSFTRNAVVSTHNAIYTLVSHIAI